MRQSIGHLQLQMRPSIGHLQLQMRPSIGHLQLQMRQLSIGRHCATSAGEVIKISLLL